MSFRIGIDVGGTFTDFLLLADDGTTEVYKVLSTPEDPAEAVLAGLGEMAAARALDLADFLAQVTLIVHGTTVTTNAVLTGNVAPTGLVTTRGFRDALEMRRGIREVLYDNKYRPPRPLVPRRLRLPVSERVDAEGQVVQAIEPSDIDAAVAQFRAAGIEAVAVCFMHAYANDGHERVAGERLAELMPEAYLSLSAEVLPQVRFYDRVSTTVLNAAVGPILRRYLTSLTARLAAARFAGTLLVMQSNGGVTSPSGAVQLAAATLLSGPAGAPVAGLAYAEAHDESSFITIDMGGTSFDAALVRDGAPGVTTAGTVDRRALALPSMEINTVGAGGGSIAWIDDSGLLRMGPQSAGADPGPACYGRGGTRPTCSDANLVLGYLNPDYFAGGAIRLDVEAARRAIETTVAAPLGLDLVAAAHGMFHVMNVAMASAIREISVQKGYDPRDFLLVCAGGAGPVHAAMIADELEIPRLLIPRDSSIFCAAGMLRSDLKHDFVRGCHTVFAEDTTDGARLRGLATDLREAGAARLAAEGIPAARQRFVHALDLRYAGQYHEVTVEVEQARLDGPDYAAIAGAFHAGHNRLYGYDLAQEGTALELVNLRVTAIGTTEKPPLAEEPRRGADAGPARTGSRPVYLPDRRDFAEVDVYDGDRLGHGHRLEGPAIVEQRNTTVFVPPGFALACDRYGSFLLTAERAAAEAAA